MKWNSWSALALAVLAAIGCSGPHKRDLRQPIAEEFTTPPDSYNTPPEYVREGPALVPKANGPGLNTNGPGPGGGGPSAGASPGSMQKR